MTTSMPLGRFCPYIAYTFPLGFTLYSCGCGIKLRTFKNVVQLPIAVEVTCKYACASTVLLKRMKHQCSKLRMHPAPCVHILAAGCMDFKTCAPGVCTIFSTFE